MRPVTFTRLATRLLGGALLSAGASAPLAAQTAAPAATPATPNFIDSRPLPPTDRPRADDAAKGRAAAAAAAEAKRVSEIEAKRVAAEIAARQAAATSVTPPAAGTRPKATGTLPSFSVQLPAVPASPPTVAPPVAASPVAAPPAPPVPGSPAVLAEAQRYLSRGRQLLQTGDITGARPFFERAVRAGSADGAVELASTFDPARLKELGVVGLKPDPARALVLYKQAQQMGASTAADRVRRLEASR